MSKVIVDPVAAAQKFKDDLAAMQVGRKDGQPQGQRLLGKSFALASFRFNRWSAELDEAQTLNDALNPQFWAGQAAQIIGYDKDGRCGRGDIIEVRQAATGLYAELLVREIGSGFIRVELIRAAKPKEIAIADNSPLVTRWNPGKRVHDVIRKSDREVMATGFQSKASAAEWIADHLAKMAA